MAPWVGPSPGYPSVESNAYPRLDKTALPVSPPHTRRRSDRPHATARGTPARKAPMHTRTEAMSPPSHTRMLTLCTGRAGLALMCTHPTPRTNMRLQSGTLRLPGAGMLHSTPGGLGGPLGSRPPLGSLGSLGHLCSPPISSSQGSQHRGVLIPLTFAGRCATLPARIAGCTDLILGRWPALPPAPYAVGSSESGRHCRSVRHLGACVHEHLELGAPACGGSHRCTGRRAPLSWSGLWDWSPRHRCALAARV